MPQEIAGLDIVYSLKYWNFPVVAAMPKKAFILDNFLSQRGESLHLFNGRPATQAVIRREFFVLIPVRWGKLIWQNVCKPLWKYVIGKKGQGIKCRKVMHCQPIFNQTAQNVLIELLCIRDMLHQHFAKDRLKFHFQLEIWRGNICQNFIVAFWGFAQFILRYIQNGIVEAFFGDVIGADYRIGAPLCHIFALPDSVQ